jgi:large subunit ribosomal protein L10
MVKESRLKPGKFLKARITKEYEDKLKGASSFFVTDFSGLTNKEIEELKNKLRSTSTKYLVVKNSLCRSALKALNIESISSMIEGSCAISYTDKDPVMPSKVLVNFSRSNERLRLKGGYVDGRALSVDTLRELASMPSREILLTRIVSAMNSPITGFVGACSGIVRKFLYALNEIRQKKEKEKNKEE